MTREERENVLHCLKSIIDEEVCPECNLYGTTGTDHCQYDMVKLAIEALSEPTKTDILSDIADLKKSPWFTFGENSLNPISREQYLARKEAVEVIEDLCIKRIDSEPTKTEPKWIEELEQEPCEEVVSRSAAIEIARSNIHYGLDKEYEYAREMLQKTMAEINLLPTVTPTRPRTIDDAKKEVLNELLNYTYGMLTTEKFGLQHKILSMLHDCGARMESEDKE